MEVLWDLRIEVTNLMFRCRLPFFACFYPVVLPICLHSFNPYISDSVNFFLFFNKLFYFSSCFKISVCISFPVPPPPLSTVSVSCVQSPSGVWSSSLPFPFLPFPSPSIQPSLSHMPTALPLGHDSLQLPLLHFNLTPPQPLVLFLGIC